MKTPKRAIKVLLALTIVGIAGYVVMSRIAPSGYFVPLDVVAHRNIHYGNARAERLDIYVPRDAHGGLPLVVWIHGGGWRIGSKVNCPAVSFAEHGFVVASIEYRFSSVALWPAQIYDAKGAIRFLRAHAATYNIDPGRIGVWGASAGGQMAAMLGTSAGVPTLEGTVGGNLRTSSAVQAVCDWYGPIDFAAMAKQIPANMLDYYDKHSAGAFLLGGPVLQHLALAKTADPVTYIKKGAPPFLIAHGDKDDVVPIAQSIELHNRLRAVGADVQFVTVHGAGHAFMDEADIQAARLFFERKLQSPPSR